MRYYRLRNDYLEKSAEISHWEGDSELLDLSLTGRINTAVNGLVLTGIIDSTKKVFDVIPAIDVSWVVSEKTKNIISLVNHEGVHFFNVSLKFVEMEKELIKYYIMSFIQNINAVEIIDFSKSSFDFYTKKAKKNQDYSMIRSFDKMVIKTNINVALDIFQLESPGYTIISEKLKKELEHKKITGFAFEPIEQG